MDWQPIETAPKDGTVVLIYQGKEECCCATAKYVDTSHKELEVVGQKGKKVISEWVEYTSGYWDADGFYDPTHWMPLPEPPK